MHCLCLAARWKRQAARFTQRLSPELPWRYHRNERRQAVSRPHKQISSDAVPVITGVYAGMVREAAVSSCAQLARWNRGAARCERAAALVLRGERVDCSGGEGPRAAGVVRRCFEGLGCFAGRDRGGFVCRPQATFRLRGYRYEPQESRCLAAVQNKSEGSAALFPWRVCGQRLAPP